MNDRALTFPAAAGGLWRRIGPAVREALAETAGTRAPYAIGGGSVLAARWNHRDSWDIDLLVSPETPLGMLAAADNPRSRFEARMREMGGTPVFNRDIQLWTVIFDDGERKLDVWASRPLFRVGEQEWTIDGRPEILLSNAQILRGKLERSDEHPARDVFDFIEARDQDPGALEAAVNAVSRRLAESIAHKLHWAGPAIAAEARTSLRGVAEEPRVQPERLGNRGAKAVSGSIYASCRIETRDGAVVVRTETVAGRRTTRRMTARDVERQFEALGLNAYLKARGPGADALRSYARAASAGRVDALVFEADYESVKAWRTEEAGMNLSPGARIRHRGTSAATSDTPRGREGDPGPTR